MQQTKSHNYTLCLQIDSAFPLDCRDGNVELVKKKIDQGISIESKDVKGHTGLILASYEGHVPIVLLLLEYKANINACENHNGANGLIYAALQGHESVVEILLERGANINTIDNNRNTPLHMATLSGHINVIEILLDNGADIESKNNNKDTPLHVAAKNGQTAVCKKLLEISHSKKCQLLSSINKEKFTAAGSARNAGHNRTANFLSQYHKVNIFLDISFIYMPNL